MLTKTHDLLPSAYIKKERYVGYIILTKNHGNKMP